MIFGVAVWATIVGVMLGIWASRDDFPVGTGSWAQATCAGIAIVGMLLLLVSDGGHFAHVRRSFEWQTQLTDMTFVCSRGSR